MPWWKALQTANGWLEYNLMASEDALTDQCTPVVEKAKEVDMVKVALQEKEGAFVGVLVRQPTTGSTRSR
jgi:hypothetical protein